MSDKRDLGSEWLRGFAEYLRRRVRQGSVNFSKETLVKKAVLLDQMAEEIERSLVELTAVKTKLTRITEEFGDENEMTEVPYGVVAMRIREILHAE